jgi:superfamily II DNA or RNA helicase/5-methylcytosine-specific restriction endonuclease McrA
MSNEHSTLQFCGFGEWQTRSNVNVENTFNMKTIETTWKIFCGCGKSEKEIDIMKKYTTNYSILLLSSIQLFNQFRIDYIDNLDKSEFEIINVCSSKYATTDKEKIEEQLSKNTGKNKLIFCLYDSLSTLTTIISHSIGIDKIDFIIADESHKLNENTTKEGKQINKTMEKYKDTMKLYFSATPSKDQKQHIAFTFSYLNGLENKILQPFDIYLEVSKSEKLDDEENNHDDKKTEEERAKKYFSFMVRNFLKTGNNKIMSFHNGVEEENQKSILPVKSFLKHENLFQEVFDTILEKEFPKQKGKHSFKIEGLHGNIKEKDRIEILQNFDNHEDENCLYILSSCLTLREGINTKTANALIWVDPRYSHTMVIQNVGRIVRKHNKKKPGSVIIPITVDGDLYDRCQTRKERTVFLQESLDLYNPGINFLNALKEEDPEIVKFLEFCPSHQTTSSLDSSSPQIRNNANSSTNNLNPKEFLNRLRIHVNFDRNEFGCDLSLEEVDNLGSTMVRKLEYTINYDPIQQKVNEMIEYTHEKKSHPKQGTKLENGFVVAHFWNHMKHGNNASFLPQCLQRSSYLKEDYQRFQARREAKQGTPTFTPEEIAKMVIKDANKNKTHPVKSKVLENGVPVGRYWSDYKNKSKKYNKKYLAQCIQESTYLAKDYQNVQEYRKKTPEQHWEAQLILALEYMCTHEHRPNDKDDDPDIKKRGQWIRTQNTNHNDFKKGNVKTARGMNNINNRTKWETVEKMMEENNWKAMETYLLELKKKHQKRENVNEQEIESEQEIDTEKDNESGQEIESEQEIETEEDNESEQETEEIQSDTEISSMSSTSDDNNINNHDDDTSDDNNESTRKNYFEEEETKYTLKKKRKSEFSEKQKKIIVERQNNKCNNSPGSDFETTYGYACLLHQNGRDGTFEEKVGYEIDHINPISNGGGNNIKNGQALCKCCHSVKTKQEMKTLTSE